MPDPMGTRITVTEELASSGTTILDIATRIGTELSTLKTQLAPLHEYWAGQANVNWQDLQKKWDTAAADLMSAPGQLGAIGNTATVNWTNYTDCETANINTWTH
ncbi:WXG100 family type VII secretion target [Plantactinospora sp. KBS50]|uniref:WXG100 family type VII secretion target n=1 Tax=Plantactinospora sp. KBS50 TaxID=2024580 RepID=UPI000BAB19AB|nr:WXG100 family type VII secretion target [Plantactinospora sp. KBS50]ASW55402.1 hypothetical protein CIK06_16350 [Plantactinospora sp. KBS50]